MASRLPSVTETAKRRLTNLRTSRPSQGLAVRSSQLTAYLQIARTGVIGVMHRVLPLRSAPGDPRDPAGRAA